MRCDSKDGSLLQWIQGLRAAEHCLVHVRELPAKEAEFAEPQRPLPPPLRQALQGLGIQRLYRHQAQAIDLVRNGKNVVVVTGTASGKSLCYHLPVLETVLSNPTNCSLYIFPTKALCQDQHGNLQDLVMLHPHLAQTVESGIYDGDTPQAQRRQIRSRANIVFTNPDMLHRALLPYHSRWARFFENLRFVVIDELHTYRGIFGANVACVLRRLRRICQHYGSSPQFIAASATIGNPQELAERLVGLPFEVVDQDGAPRGRKLFCFWVPPIVSWDRSLRAPINRECVRLLTPLIVHGARVITFALSRMGVELIYRELKAALERIDPALAQQVRAYRGGYLPNERRQIERDLFSGKLRAVISTNALELGIDVGSLDVAVLVGYPGSIASTWQQAGRAGRKRDDSLAVLIARDDPIDQFLVRHPDYFFAKSPEHAVVDPENPYILVRHLACAAFEIALDEEKDPSIFGSKAQELLPALRQEGVFSYVGGRYHYRDHDNPAARINLRHLSDNTVTIMEKPRDSDDGHVIATVDEYSADTIVHPQAVYIHDGQTYLVYRFDPDDRIAYVERKETGYFTQAVVDTRVVILREEKSHVLEVVQEVLEREQPAELGQAVGRYGRIVRRALGLPQKPRLPDLGPGGGRLRAATGELNVSWTVVAFRKIRFGSYETLGMGHLEMPRRDFDTQGMWLTPSDQLLNAVRGDATPMDALLGVLNLLLRAVPFVALAETADIGGTLDSSNLGQVSIFLWDRYPGGLGYCEKAYTRLPEVLRVAYEIVRDCPCKDGCPSCVGLSRRLGLYRDPDASGRTPIPNKRAARLLLEILTKHCRDTDSVAAST